jgi:hypothetical protein
MVLSMAIIVGILMLVERLSGVLLPFFIAWLIAYLLYPLVKFFQYTLRLRNRLLSIFAAFASIGAVGTAAAFLLVPPVMEEFTRVNDLLVMYFTDELNTNTIPHNLSEFIRQNIDAEAQLSWLDETLKNAKEDWVIVVGHHPIYAYTTKKENERLDMQKRLLPILHKYNNVAIYACGHIHNFQHIQKKGDNIDYVVNSSSSLARPVKPIDGTVFCSPADGFSVFTADKKQLRMSMIDKDGKIIHTVTKSK